jgi:hypothetical protein
MQAAKDTFLKTLAARLAVVNPARTMTLDGVTRPAVLAVENETPIPAGMQTECFLLSWERSGWETPETGLMWLECKVSYGSRGTETMLRGDRGRTVTAMENELLQMIYPRSTAEFDYTKTPPLALGANIFWSLPEMAGAKDVEGVLLRTATLRLHFFPEVG